MTTVPTTGDRMPIPLDGESLTFEQLRQIAGDRAAGSHASLELSDRGRERVAAARATVEKLLQGTETAYGINTGFGRFCRVRITPDEVRELQVNLIRSHGTGVGEPLEACSVRLAMAFRANTLARGNSGVREQTLQLLLDAFNHDIIPWIPRKGSVGACGDLAPLAHLAQVLIGEGRARRVDESEWRSGGEVLESCGLKPVELEAKEGLALINGVQISAAMLAEAVIAADRLVYAADVAGALSLEASLGSARPFDPRIHQVRPHPGQGAVAERFRELLAGSKVLDSHVGCGKVQDAYSFRCIPQVHGAVRGHVGVSA